MYESNVVFKPKEINAFILGTIIAVNCAPFDIKGSIIRITSIICLIPGVHQNR